MNGSLMVHLPILSSSVQRPILVCDVDPFTLSCNRRLLASNSEINFNDDGNTRFSSIVRSLTIGIYLDILGDMGMIQDREGACVWSFELHMVSYKFQTMSLRSSVLTIPGMT